jgi:hypothetical protein
VLKAELQNDSKGRHAGGSADDAPASACAAIWLIATEAMAPGTLNHAAAARGLAVHRTLIPKCGHTFRSRLRRERIDSAGRYGSRGTGNRSNARQGSSVRCCPIEHGSLNDEDHLMSDSAILAVMVV